VTGTRTNLLRRVAAAVPGARLLARWLRRHTVNVPAASDEAEPIPASPIPSGDFHNLLHELRTATLRTVPKGASVVVSVGASGRWYFDWFEQNYGRVARHVGMEAFEAQPPDLPPYAEWLARSADRFDDIATASVDLVFAGQTTEHLWPRQLSGFLREAARVLRPDGLLVMDSPNRLVTEHLSWSHGGHTFELSCDEMMELTRLAGFRVERRLGLWACRWNEHVHELEEGLADPSQVSRRIALATDAPDDAFVWWIVARRDGREPSPVELERRVGELFRSHWPTRVCRAMWPGHPTTELSLTPGRSGLVASGLPFPMHAGEWTLTVDLARGDLAALRGLRVRIVAPGPHLLHDLPVTSAVTRTARRATWRFVQPSLQLALQLGVDVQHVRRPCSLHMPLELVALSDPTA